MWGKKAYIYGDYIFALEQNRISLRYFAEIWISHHAKFDTLLTSFLCRRQFEMENRLGCIHAHHAAAVFKATFLFIHSLLIL